MLVQAVEPEGECGVGGNLLLDAFQGEDPLAGAACGGAGQARLEAVALLGQGPRLLLLFSGEVGGGEQRDECRIEPSQTGEAVEVGGISLVRGQQVVEQAVEAERAGFDFVELSDHYHPWLEAQGHSGFTWSMLGAMAAQTERVGLVTGVTCPFFRYHPAIIAQAAATCAEMLDGKFILGVGSGEALNEHILGDEWPSADRRLEMLEEAVELGANIGDRVGLCGGGLHRQRNLRLVGGGEHLFDASDDVQRRRRQ